MAGRRGARAGRGWDAIPPRPADEEPSGDELRRDGTGRGNVSGRRRRSSWSDLAAADPDANGKGLGGLAVGGSDTNGLTAEGLTADGLTADGLDVGVDSSGRGGRGARAQRGGAGGGRDRDGSAGARPGGPPQSESELAREICLRQLAVRPRTRAELAKVLVRKEISDEVIAEVLERYDEVGIIDDAAFARAWVSSRHHGRGLARRALANELRQRGVEAAVASEALETIDEDEEAATARALVDRKLRTATGTPEAVFRRLVGMLARKGYPAGVAIRAVKDALAARDAEAAEFADQIDPDALADESSGIQT
jgi:regulatory protein